MEKNLARIYIMFFVLAILSGIGYGAYYIYNDTMTRMVTLRDNNAKLEVALKQKDITIKALEDNMKKQLQLTNDLNSKLQKAEQNNRKIADLLAKTDIVKNSLADPEAVEKKINEQVNTIFKSIDSVTTTK
jgi:Tfp pilus assembly protein PilO